MSALDETFIGVDMAAFGSVWSSFDKAMALPNGQEGNPFRIYGSCASANWRAMYHLQTYTLARPEIYWTSDWVHVFAQQWRVKDEDFRALWSADHEHIRRSDFLLCIAGPKDKLCGSLVEIGMALAYRIPVLLCGKNRAFSTWTKHPGVSHVHSFEDTLRSIAFHRMGK